MGLKFIRVSKRFGDRWALRDVDLEVFDGEKLGVLGETGSGKSTLLSIAAGDDKPSMGEISANPSIKTRRYDAQHEGSKGLFGLRPGKPTKKRSIGEVISVSSGEVLLIDNAFCSLDEFEKKEAVDAIRGASGRTIMLAGSNFRDLADACDRIAVLVRGELAQIGTPEEVYRTPASSLAAFATGEINRFDARRLSSTNAEQPEFFTIEGEHRIFARPTERSGLGPINQTINLAIRPEHISISTGASFPEDNLLRAIVRDIRFLGPSTRVSLDANGLKLDASVPRVVGLEIGEECMIALPPHRVHIFRS